MDGDDAADPLARARRALGWLGVADVVCAMWFVVAVGVLYFEFGPLWSQSWVAGMIALWCLGAAGLALAGLGVMRGVRASGAIRFWLVFAIAAGVVGTTPVGVGTFAFGPPRLGRNAVENFLTLTLAAPPLVAVLHGVLWLLHATAIRRLDVR